MMIKILHVIPSLQSGGGVQNRLLDNYSNMNNRDIQFDFIVHGKDKGDLEEIVTGLGGKVYHIPTKKENLFGNIFEMWSIIRLGEYDIVQSHMEYAGVIPMFWAWLSRVPIRIAHGHVVDVTTPNVNSRLNSFLSFMLNLFSNNFWACSSNAGRWLFKRDRKDLIIIPNAIDVSAYKYDENIRKIKREEFGLTDELAIVNVGRMSKFKNQEFLFPILKILNEKGVRTKLFIIGNGNLMNDLKMKAEEQGVIENVFFLGNRNDVNVILQAMDIMVHTAFSEGLGNVLIEGQAAGLKVVASSDGIPEETHITDNIHYISLGEGEEKWSNYIIELKEYDRKDMTQVVAAAGFDCKIQALELEKKYKELCEVY